MVGKSGAKNRETPEEQDNKYVVEKIVDDRIIKGKTQYKVHWEGYNSDEETWENESELDCDEILDEYLADKHNETNSRSPKRSKTKKESTKKPKPKEEEASSSGDNKYVVSKIVDERRMKGKLQYRVHWEGYKDEEDTWENKSDLDCQEVLDEYIESKKKKVSEETTKSKPNPGSENGGDNEYEVERILDMHTFKNGQRQFLVKWVGYSRKDATWEPEENLKGGEILEKFLEKVEQAKALSTKELRIARKPTDRFSVMPQGDKRRASKRNANRQRVKYYDAE